MKPHPGILLTASLFGIPSLAGCGGSLSSSSPTLIASQPRSVSATTPNGLAATLTENADTIGQNGSITCTVTLAKQQFHYLSEYPRR